jgi:tetratricopeptide (TPR) repeat protein
MVGAARLRARVGEERADELRRVHDDLLTIRADANGGKVLKSQGDGLVAAFPSAADALSAAVEMEQAVEAHNRRSAALAEVSLRIGLSVGDVTWDGPDCFGTPLVEAARLLAAADAGQILCSEFVRVMARGRGGHAFSDFGFLDLKGLPEPVAACEVLWTPIPEPTASPLALPAELASPAGGRLVSRSDELRLAERVVGDPGRTRLAVLWLLGEPGIGKTRLAAEMARRAHTAGAVVLFGRCSEDLSVPYQPFVEALRTFVEQVPATELRGRLGETPGELLRLVPDLARRVPGLPAPAETGGGLEQHRLFEAVRSWLACAGGDRPVLAVFDDVHWAAGPTLQMLGHLARSADPSRTVVVCTARNTSPDANEELGRLAGELDRQAEISHRLELGGLGLEAVGELVEQSAGRRLDDRLRSLALRVHTETAGNPLFVGAVLSAVEDADAELPRTVSETVRRRVERLPNSVGDLLRTASVAGLDFDLRVLARAAECRELDALDAVEQAERAGLVEEYGPNQYRFVHALVRAALRDELSQSRRVRLHLQVGEALEAVYAAVLDDHADALAYHFSEAIPAGATAKAFEYTVAAARRAARLFANADAVAGFGRALDLLSVAGSDDPLARCDLLSALATAHDRAGDYDAARQAARAAFDEASAHGAAAHVVDAALTFEGATFRPGKQVFEAVELLERAEAALPPGDSARRAVVMATLGRALLFAQRPAEGIERGAAALAMARRVADPVTLGQVLGRSAFADVAVERAPALSARAHEMMALAEETGDEEVRGWGLYLAIWPCLQRGDLLACDRFLSEIGRHVWWTKQPLWNSAAGLLRHLRAMIAGDLDLAERSLAGFGETTGAWGAEGVHGLLTFLLRREQGRLENVAPALRAIVRLQPEGAFWQPGLVALYVELGMMAEARHEFEYLAADRFAAIPEGGGAEIALGLAADACVALGDAERATELFDLISACRGRLLVGFNQACLGPADRLLALLAATAGRNDEAEHLFSEAIDFCRRMPSPLWLAHCLHDAAVHVPDLSAGQAESMRAEAAALCERHGLAGLAQKLAATRR